LAVPIKDGSAGSGAGNHSLSFMSVILPFSDVNPEIEMRMSGTLLLESVSLHD